MKTRVIVLGVLFAIIIVVLSFLLVKGLCCFITEIISIASMTASLIGILVTLTQVSSAMEKTKEVRDEVQKNTKEIRAFQSYVDFSMELKEVNSLLVDLSLKEYRSLQSRITDLKAFLVKQKSNSMIDKSSDWESRNDALILSLGIDIKNLLDKQTNRGAMLDLESISTHLSQASELLAVICGQIENDRYEQNS